MVYIHVHTQTDSTEHITLLHTGADAEIEKEWCTEAKFGLLIFIYS